MKETMIVIWVCAISPLVGAIEREAEPRHAYLSAGFSVPTGTLGDGWDLGFDGQIGVGIKTAPQFEFVPSVAYHFFPIDKQGLDFTGGRLDVLMVGGDFRYSASATEQRTAPFILAGAGIGLVSVSDISGYGVALRVDSETKPYLNFGVGMEFKTSPSSSLIISTRYVSVFTSDESVTWIPLNVGMRF